ncbi:MAG: ABC transporter permease, partial [Porphyromonadaceae bacterium]|nr:ABC transporter permease [Porphyromonadaceae bacterium]
MKSFSRHLLQLLLGATILHALWLAGYLLIRSEVLPAPWAVYTYMAHLNGSDLLTHTLT